MNLGSQVDSINFGERKEDLKNFREVSFDVFRFSFCMSGCPRSRGKEMYQYLISQVIATMFHLPIHEGDFYFK